MSSCHIKEFLLDTILKFVKKPSELNNVKVIMCNESCDLDSVVSAVIYSYLLHSLDKDMEFGSVMPLLNMKKEEFALRTEVKYLFAKFAITEDLLLFRDTYDLNEILDSGKLKLYLVDHNVLSPSDSYLDPFVVSILDHHQLERTDTPVHGMIVEPVGSCCTLVAEQILQKNPDIFDEIIASLLYGTILLDTINLNEVAKRATPKDVFIIEHLESYLKYEPSNREEVFQELISAKADISDLTIKQILLKDLKFVFANNIHVALSSVPLLVNEFLLKVNLEESISAFFSNCMVDILILIGINLVGDIQRDVAVISNRKSHLEEVSSYLQNANNSFLGLEPFETNVKNCIAFSQTNLNASRKDILPLVRLWVESKR